MLPIFVIIENLNTNVRFWVYVSDFQRDINIKDDMLSANDTKLFTEAARHEPCKRQTTKSGELQSKKKENTNEGSELTEDLNYH